MPFAYILIDTERKTAETWVLDLCFLRGFVWASRIGKYSVPYFQN
jgi:hypothetical protein